MDNPSSQPELPQEAPGLNDFVSAPEEHALLQSPPALSSESVGAETPSIAAPELPLASVPPPVALLLPDATKQALLENRLQRLEADLAQMRNSAAAATRIAQQPASAAAHESSSFWGRLLSPSAPAKTARGASGLPSIVPNSVRRTWLLLDALAELRAMYWMFFDPRYHLSWTARLAPLVILALIMTSYYWMAGTWMQGTILLFFIGTVIEKLCDLILAYFLFKLLSYESRRYRETAPDLPPSLRL